MGDNNKFDGSLCQTLCQNSQQLFMLPATGDFVTDG
jgi:hypothetical protein